MHEEHEQIHLPFDNETGVSLTPEFVDLVVACFHADEASTVRPLVLPLPAPDLAELLDQLEPEARRWLTEAIAQEFDSDILPELSEEAAEDVVDALGAIKTAEALAELESDDAVHIIENLAPAEQNEILEGLPTELREEIEEGLTYPDESAGRLMRKHLVSVPENWTVGDTIDYLRAQEELPEHFYVIYVVDARNHPLGRLLLGTMLQHKRDVKIADILTPATYAVDAYTDQEEVAHLFRKYALVETPVVNEEGVLVGTITVDDVVDVMQEEDDEDYLRAGGVTYQDIKTRLLATARSRFHWLFVNLLTAILASMVVGLFEATIEQIVALAVMMPIVASMGGNAGTQSVTVSVRAIAMKYISEQNRRAFVQKEALIGLLNGLALGMIMAVGIFLWFADIKLALVMFLAAVVTMTVAGLFGAWIPIMLQRMKVDPAISSSIFLTTVTDCMGFFSFLGLATLILL